MKGGDSNRYMSRIKIKHGLKADQLTYYQDQGQDKVCSLREKIYFRFIYFRFYS